MSAQVQSSSPSQNAKSKKKSSGSRKYGKRKTNSHAGPTKKTKKPDFSTLQGKLAYVQKMINEQVIPAVEPIWDIVAETYRKEPEYFHICLSVVALLFGGCFDRLALLYAAYNLSNASTLIADIKSALLPSNAESAGSVSDNATKVSPEAAEGLLLRFCLEACIFVAALNSSLVAALMLGSLLGGKASGQIVTIAGARIKAARVFESAEAEKMWTPFIADIVCKFLATGLGIMSPSAVAALYLGSEAGYTIVKKVMKNQDFDEHQHYSLGWVLAINCTVYQAMCGFGPGDGMFGNVSYLLMLPLFVANKML